MPVAHDARVIGIVRNGRIHRGDGVSQRRDKRVDAAARHQHVIGCDTRLPRIEKLGERDAPGGHGKVGIGVDDGR